MPVQVTEDDRRDRRELERVRLLVLAAQRDGARRLTDALRPVQLSAAQAEIIGVLASDGAMSLADLGRRVVCESGSPSRAVDLLVRRGLVAREQDPRDRRYVELTLTDEGRSTIPTLVSAARSLDDLLVERLTDDELRILATLLTRLLTGTRGLDAVERRCGTLAHRDD